MRFKQVEGECSAKLIALATIAQNYIPVVIAVVAAVMAVILLFVVLLVALLVVTADICMQVIKIQAPKKSPFYLKCITF